MEDIKKSNSGIKIKKYEAGSIKAYKNAVRDYYDTKIAMLGYSLFTEYLLENGLALSGEYIKSTKDIICIGFKYGSRSQKEEIKFLNNKICNLEKNEDESFSEEEKEKRLNFLRERKKFAEDNEELFVKTKPDDLRIEFYENGVDIDHFEYNKKGEIKNKKTIHYRMLYRTPGKAKSGECMFINERLYEKALKFLRMGIKLPIEKAPIVEIGAYSSLITSTIDQRIGDNGKMKIHPNNILVIKDFDAFYETKVLCVEKKSENECAVNEIDNYKLKNTCWDGQALIDTSIFPNNGNGYVLLRNHFFKAAAFCTNIKKFFQDYCKENGHDYSNYTINDMFGNKRKVSEILFITTDNAMKWLKFTDYGIDFNYWCNKVIENNCNFGIVKTAHESKQGINHELQRMSYQMVNSLEMTPDFIDGITACSKEYIKQLKNDNEVFIKYLENNKTKTNDYEVLKALYEYHPDFYRSKYFKRRKSKIIEHYVEKVRSGKLLQGDYTDNLVIVGSPYAMLLSAVGEDPLMDKTFSTEKDSIQCYTERFDPQMQDNVKGHNINNSVYLSAFRSPFNGKGNLCYLHNIKQPREFKEYFSGFGRQVIAINMIGTCLQDRCNGSDQDSDALLVCPQKDIVECARKCYQDKPTIINKIPKDMKTYDNSAKSFAIVDNELAAAGSVTGEASNLAQLALTYTYNTDGDEKAEFEKKVACLSVLAQVAIDNAKRKYKLDLPGTIDKIREEMDISSRGHPEFWTYVIDNSKSMSKSQKSSQKNKILKEVDEARKGNRVLRCPMNEIVHMDVEAAIPLPGLEMDYFFKSFELKEDRRKSKKVEEFIQNYSRFLYNNNPNTDGENDIGDEDPYAMLELEFEKLLKDIKEIYIADDYRGLISTLIDRAFCITEGRKYNREKIKTTTDRNKSLLLKILYDINPEALLECFSENK